MEIRAPRQKTEDPEVVATEKELISPVVVAPQAKGFPVEAEAVAVEEGEEEALAAPAATLVVITVAAAGRESPIPLPERAFFMRVGAVAGRRITLISLLPGDLGWAATEDSTLVETA